MPRTDKCYGENQLQQYNSGQLPDPQAAVLEEHLLDCDSCLGTVHGLSVGDTLIEILRSRHTDDQTGADEFAVIMLTRFRERLAALDTAEKADGAENAEPELTGSSASESAEEGFDFLTPSDQPGEMGRLDCYRVLSVLGTGGMGVVFEAEDVELERPVALKVMKRELAADKVAKDRFVREAKVTAKLDHDNVVTIYRVGEANGVPFLAMQRLAGEPLDDRARRERQLPLDEVIRIGYEAALGLAAAHEKGLVHRDIKPSNLWLESSANDRVKILDFGLARTTERKDAKITQSGTLLGTPAYMAPEQTRGEPADFRSDLFSLGSVLYRLVTGQTPFRAKDAISVLIAVASKDPTPIDKFRSGVPAALNELILQLLNKDAPSRPASAREVATRLDQIARGLGADRTQVRHAQTPGAASPVAKKSTRKQPQEKTEAITLTPQPKASRPRRLGTWVALFLLAALVGVGVVFGGTVFRFVTNQGVLVIDVQDPSIEVVVKMGGVVVQDKTNKREFTLDAKEGHVQVFEKGGIGPLLTKEFSLNRGGKTTVSVTLKEMADAKEPGDPPGGSEPRVPNDDLDRTFAEWYRTKGGILGLQFDGKTEVVSPKAPLPKTAFRVVEIQADAQTKLAEADIERMMSFGLKHVEHIDFGYQPVTPRWIEIVAENMPNLKAIDGLPTRPEYLTVIAKFQKLESFRVANYLGDELAEMMSERPTIRSLQFALSGLTPKGIAELQKLPHLESLHFDREKFGDAGLQALAKLQHLRRLTFRMGSGPVTEKGLLALGDLKTLEHLVLPWTTFSPKVLEALQNKLPDCTIFHLDPKTNKIVAFGEE